MRYHISHRIKYTYSAPVFLEPHTVRMRPRCDAGQQVEEFVMNVDPAPAGRHDFLDPEGNNASCLWFTEQINSLQVATSFNVRTSCTNPFSYLVTDDAFFRLPVHYGNEDAALLGPYLSPVDQDEALIGFARAIAERTGEKTIDFLSLLCTAIYENFAAEIRHKGRPQAPSVTIEKGRGACRDLARLYVAACRSVGLAARFVSGYQEGSENMEYPYLHAWAEVYIPGGGWRGYDPTHGLAVADRHVVLAASHDSSGAAPLKGTFRGTAVTAEMDYSISLSAIPGQGSV